MMKSVIAVEDRKGRRTRRGLRVFTFAVGAYVLVLLLSGCSWRQPGETVAEVERRHDRVLRLDTEMMLSDLDRALLLDRPSMLTDKRIP